MTVSVTPEIRALRAKPWVGRYAGDITVESALKAFADAQTLVEPLGCRCEWAKPAAIWEAFHVIGTGVRLVVYPHRTTAGNRHLRVRNSSSADAAKAREVMRAMGGENNLGYFAHKNGGMPA